MTFYVGNIKTLFLTFCLSPIPLAEVWVSQSRSCEDGRAVRITHLSCGDMGGRDAPAHQSLRQVGELTLRS